MSDFAHRPPDQSERDRIAGELDRNILVEAGAGSGKTRSLVDRMVALVDTGTCTADRIVAVTFTRKAAAELRQRFQVRLEEALAPNVIRRPPAASGLRTRSATWTGPSWERSTPSVRSCSASGPWKPVSIPVFASCGRPMRPG